MLSIYFKIIDKTENTLITKYPHALIDRIRISADGCIELDSGFGKTVL